MADTSELYWPRCLQATKLLEFGLPKPLVYIGRTLAGIESRQLVSPVPRGAYLELEFRWISEDDDDIEEFYNFWVERAVGPWNVFRIDKSNIPCLVPGWNSYQKTLPSQLWRIDVDDDTKGFPITPSNCCSVDFKLRLVNILLPESDYLFSGIDRAMVQQNTDNPILTTPRPQ